MRDATQSGQFIVELLVAIGLMLVILPPLTYVMIATRESKPLQDVRAAANTLVQETYEAMRSVRERGWSYVAVNGTYHPVVSGGAWELASGAETVGGFTRQVTISDVYRDAGGAIVETGGSLDPSTKKIVATISWTLPSAASLSSTWFLSRYVRNSSVVHTTEADFAAGVVYNTQVANTLGGEITLANNNKGKWCSPSFSQIAIDLPDGPPVAVVATASASVSTPNDVFVATAPSPSSSIKMAYVNVTADTENPAATLRGVFTLDPARYSSGSYVPTGIDLTNAFKTNDIKYYKSPAGKVYALMTTNLPDKEVIAVQVNDGSGDSFQDPVNKIYRYWTYFNTKAYSAAFNNPSSHAAETSGAGDNNGFQTSPTNAYTLNGSYAVDSNSGSGTGTSCTGADKDKHQFYDYGFSLPAGAAINGIEVQLSARVDSTSGSPKMCVSLSWDGGVTWTTPKSTPTLTTSNTAYTLGGASDTWGRTWTDSELSNANFRLRIVNVASSTLRDFSLDYAGVKVHYNGISTAPNDQDPFGYGPRTLTILGDRGYVAAGGYLYVFDLTNIDAKSAGNGLDQVGCRIQLDGYDCSPGTGVDRKYAAGETGTSWSDTTTPVHNDCSDGGNVELFATNHIDGVTVGGNNYIYVAIGAGTNPEFAIVNATDVPNESSSPPISSVSCGRITGGNAGWKRISSYDFNSASGTEEAANSVYAAADGTRAYISSNGGIDGNGDSVPDSKQWYIINTTNKSSPTFLSGSPSTGATSGFYEATSAADLQLFPRRSLTVLNKSRAVLVGSDGISDANDAREYQVLNIDNEATPLYCGGLNFNQGFNDLTSVSEADGDNYVYMVANTIDKQLKIIEGGPDSGIYITPGTYESPVIDVGSSAALNRFSGSVSLPASTSIRMQVASAAPVGGSCSGASYSYIGPDGTAATYFTPVGSTVSASFPVGTFGGYENPNQCFRYKVFMETADTNQTPVLYDLGINYSP